MAKAKATGKKLSAYKGKKAWEPNEEPLTEFGHWFSRSKLPADWLIDTLGCARGYAYELLRGVKTPSLAMLVVIIEASRGTPWRNLKPEDFLTDDLR